MRDTGANPVLTTRCLQSKHDSELIIYMKLKTTTMKTIKFLKNNLIKVNGVLYTPYTVGDLPQSFGFIFNSDKDQTGVAQWFNFKGLTYIIKP